MASDMVVALGRSTVDGRTLFGHNSGRPSHSPPSSPGGEGRGVRGEGPWLVRTPGRCFAPGERLRTQHLELPQARQTYTVVGGQSKGLWGYHHGVNEHGVAIGYTTLRTRLQCDRPGLLGTDLVRLGLERANSARQAVELLTDLVSRHGQGAYPGCPPADRYDSALLIADAAEAFAVETSGQHWVYQEIQQVRAMSDVCTIHQDWDWIARGLASHAIGQGWWPADGSKLDFATAVSAAPDADRPALRRWGRATLLLEQQNGHIDLAFIRRLLGDHYEGTEDEADPLHKVTGPEPICRHEGTGGATAASLVAPLGGVPMAWCAFGPPCTGVYLPVFLDGDLPSAFGRDRESAEAPLARRLWQLVRQVGGDAERWAAARVAFDQLQARLDLDAEEFLAETADLRERGDRVEFGRLAGLFMQHAAERFETVLEGLLTPPARQAAPAGDLEPAGAPGLNDE